MCTSTAVGTAANTHNQWFGFVKEEVSLLLVTEVFHYQSVRRLRNTVEQLNKGLHWREGGEGRERGREGGEREGERERGGRERERERERGEGSERERERERMRKEKEERQGSRGRRERE